MSRRGFDFASGGGGSIPPGSVTNAMLANMAARTVKVNATNAAAAPQDLQGTTPFNVLQVNSAGTGLEWSAVTATELSFTTNNRIAGRITAGAGASEELTAAQVKTILAYTASEVANVPAGNIAATNAQAAINELDTEKVAKAGDTMTGPLVINAGSGFTPGTSGLTLRSDDPGTIGPVLVTHHNSASPAANDIPFILQMNGKISTAAEFTYSQMFLTALDPTAGSEDARITFTVAVAGATATRLTIGSGLVVEATGGEQGTGTINAAAYYANANLIADTNGIIKSRPYTVGTLPAAGTQGRRALVTDSLAPAFGAAVAAGGAAIVPVYDTGAAWQVG